MVDSEQKKTICIGRLQLDVPQNALVSLRGSYRSAELIDVSPAENFDEVKREANERAKGLSRRLSKPQDAGDDAFDRRAGIDSTKDRAASRLIGIDGDPRNGTIAVGFHTDDATTRFAVDLDRFIEGKRYRFRSLNSRASRYASARDYLVESVSKYRLLEPGIAPTERGFCLGAGIFVDRDRGDPEANESFVLTVKFPGYPGLTFSLDSEAIAKIDRGEPPLSQRADLELVALREEGGAIAVIERGRARYADQDGYEIGISARHAELPGGQTQKYTWQAEGRPGDVGHPRLEAELMTGQDERVVSQSDAFVSALWKRLMGSLRLRPGSI